MRDQGGPAYARPTSQIDHSLGSNIEYAEVGLSYRDLIVMGMMQTWFKNNVTPEGKFAQALIGDTSIQEAVRSAHKVADVIMQERHL